jgi:hypothetical protein
MPDIKTYRIEHWQGDPVNKWHGMFPFTSMRKSEAQGAWAMLKAFYNHRTRHRLVDNTGAVIEEIGEQKVSVT